MKKSLPLFTAIALAAMAAPSLADDTPTASYNASAKTDANGNYTGKTTVERTDSAGTATEAETKVKVSHDSHGNVKKTVVDETSTDPKGLFNKTTEKDTTTSQENPDGTTTVRETKKVNGKKVEDEKTTN